MSFTHSQAPYDQPPHPLLHLALVLGHILWGAITHAAAHESPLVPRIALAIRRLQRARTRLLAILTHLAEGTWRAPRRRAPRTTRRTSTPSPYLPRRRGWLGHVTDHHVRGHASQLAHLLAEPGTQSLIAAAPASARAALIRALRGPSRLLAVDLPSVLQLPGPPRPPRKRRLSPRRSRGQPEGGSSSPRALKPGGGLLPTDRPIPKNVLAFARYNRRRFGKGG